MMDPFNALAVAGGVVQFLEFGFKFVRKVASRTHDVYKTLEEHDNDKISDENCHKNIEKILGREAERISVLTARLRSPGTEHAPQRPGASSGSHSDPVQEQIDSLCAGCNTIAAEMMGHINQFKVQGQHSKLKILRNAVLATWNEDKLHSISQRLNTMRSSLELHLLVDIRSKLDGTRLHEIKYFEQMHEDTKQLVSCLLAGQGSLAQDVRDQTLALTQVLHRVEAVLEENRQLQQGDVSTQLEAGGQARNDASPAMFKERFVRQAVSESVLESLEFKSMYDREQTIEEAHPKTFDWIFEEPQSDQDAQEHFAQWLIRGSGVFWISGKAGSGKSVLMRHIQRHIQHHDYLGRWADPLPATVAEFFFWNSGSVDQRSQVGFLRSILHGILSKHPALIPLLFPGDWARRYSKEMGLLEVTAHRDREEWTVPKLSTALRGVITQRATPLKLFLLIDGLDEYDGDHDAMAELFHDFASSKDVKVCLSSRPLIVFEEAFRQCPKLRLQDLTYNDINEFVISRLGSKKRFQLLARQQPKQAEQLVDEIVTRANGVFLWVKLVVRSLVSGLGNRDDIVDLQARLRLLPEDLEDLYSHMLASIDSVYRAQASEIFQMVRACQTVDDNVGRGDQTDVSHMTALLLSFALEICAPDADQNVGNALSVLGPAERCEQVGDLLKSRCLGLLEVENSTHLRSTIPVVDRKVVYLHRTVRDYLSRPTIWSGLLSLSADEPFNPHEKMLQAFVIHLESRLSETRDGQRPTGHQPSAIQNVALSHGYYADLSVGNPKTQLRLLTRLQHHVDRSHDGTYGAQEPFLYRAIQFGCSTFVDSELSDQSSGGRVLYDGQRISLLEYALAPQHAVSSGLWYSYRPVSMRTVEVLLRHGAKLNKDYEGYGSTPWTSFLRSLWEHRNSPKAKNLSGERERMLLWLSLFEFLVSKGADKRASIVDHSRRVSAAEIAGEVFIEYDRDRTVALQDALESKTGAGTSKGGRWRRWKKIFK